MAEHLYRGWKIESVEAAEGRRASYAGLGRGEMYRFKKSKIFLVHYPEGGTKTVASLAAAKKYIDDYNGW